MSEEFVNLDAVRADDAMLDEIGRGSHRGRGELERLLVAWRAQVDSVPAPAARDTLDRVLRRYRRRRRWQWLTGWWKR